MPSSLLPLPFYLCCIVAIVLAYRAWDARSFGWGIPMLVATATTTAWYVGDVLYNNYAEYIQIQGVDSLTQAWWEVLLYYLAFGFLVPLINRKINGNLKEESQIIVMIKNHITDTNNFQDQVDKICRVLILPWIILLGFALIKSNFNFVGIFFPYLGEKVNPWGRDRIGGGLDAIFAFAIYFQTLITALFGVVLALTKRTRTLSVAGIIYFLSAPFFIFDRTRNTMLAILLPGFMAFITFRLRGGMLIRIAVAMVSFLALDSWFKFVLEHRAKGESIAQAYKADQVADKGDNSYGISKKKKHEGFNMLEELGYINYFIENGTYKVNWGERYFAEIVNPIPRVLWPSKPLIGIDYAIARGMAYGNVDAKSGGVAASFSTGMIGQGVVNFGGVLGPIAAALLMAIWVAVLARQDMLGQDIGHLLLYAIGLVLTFNMGRDITLLVIYPFVFGWILLTWLNKRNAKISQESL